ncbi:MAG: porin [Hyphomonadaceae bacterium]|nr:porin [Hyphomonadaceae bacterium]
MRTAVASFAAALGLAFLAGPPAAADSLDLDVRLAELEATVARTGRSAATLRIYGQVNRAVLYWNDSIDRKVSVADNSTSSSRLGFIGERALGPGLVVGYRLELGLDPTAASQDLWNGLDATAAHWPVDSRGLRMRHAYWFLSYERLGRVSLGRQSPATDDLTIINLGSQMNDAAVHFNRAFNIRLNHPALGPIFSDLKWGQIAHTVDALRGDFIRYDTPTLQGFMLSASFGERDTWDVALRYRADGQGLHFAGGIGFMDNREDRYRDLKGSASLLHAATGLYLSMAAGMRENDRSSIIGRPPAYFHYLQGGISKHWLPFGATTVYADVGLYRNFSVGELLSVDPNSGHLVIWGTLAQTEALRWGFGVEQAFEATGVLLYAQAHRYQPTVIGFPCANGPTPFADQCGGNPANRETLPMQPWSAFLVGARIRF